MPTFIADPPQALFLLIAATGLVTGVVWLNRRQRRPLFIFLGVLALAFLVVLVDRFFESPREEAVRRVQAMMSAADRHDPDAFANHLADRVIYRGDQGEIDFTREQLRKHAFWSLLHQFNVHVAAWDFSRDDVSWPTNDSVVIGFLAKGELRNEGGKQFPFYFRATFSRQSDGEYKLTRLESFDPMARQNKRLSIPGLGTR